MKQIILASHGSLAKGMKSAVKMIAVDVSCIFDYNLDDYISPVEIRLEIEQSIKDNAFDEFILITDIKGGSVFNELTKLCIYSNIILISVMTLPLVLEINMMLNSEKTAKEIASIVMPLALKTCEILDYEKLSELLSDGKEDFC